MAKPKSCEAQLTEFKKSQNHLIFNRTDPEQMVKWLQLSFNYWTESTSEE